MDNLTSLPERWCVKWNKEIGLFYDKMCNSSCYKDVWIYLSSHNDEDIYILDADINKGRSFSGSRGTLITFEQFERFVLNKQLNTQWLW